MIAFLLLIIIPILIFFFKSGTPKIKGYIGEKIVSSVLKRLNDEEYTIINNVSLNIKGRNTQIDHIIISDFGVFVIETKNYKGWILGYENSMYWTQVIYKFKVQFYNPIRQNRGHIFALKHILKDIQHTNYISIVTFSRNATLKVTTATDVIYTDRLIEVITNYTVKTLNEKAKQKMIHRIHALNTNRKGKNSIPQSDELEDYKERCPRCSGYIVSRYGRFGPFKGCSNYPNCGYTSNYK